MPEGFIKFWRTCLESNSWKTPTQWRLWTWCLLKAEFEEHDEVIGRQTIHILPGQFTTNLKDTVKETGLSPQQIRTQLSNMQTNKQITINSTNKYTIISIVNWDKYQTKTTNKTHHTQHANQQTAPTIYKEEVKEGKKIYGSFNNVLLTEKEYQKLTERFGEAVCKEKIEVLSEGIASKGYKYTSHYATILSWDRLEKKRAPLPKPDCANTREDYGL